MLRPYQQRLFDVTMQWVRRCTDPCVLEAATGAGKTHVIAAIAEALHSASGRSVLCLAPSAELVHQNRDKYLATGNPASIYSASGGRKCLRNPVVFGTPGTVVKATRKLAGKVAAVVIDEAHGITPTVRKIVHELRTYNPLLRVIGLTATPYRLDSGYIYAVAPDGSFLGDNQTREPYFTKLLDRVTAHELIADGYLTPPIIGATDDHYDASGLERSRTGQFTGESVERAFVGQGRKTSKIIADIVHRSRDRQGVMIFAASVRHAEECMESLPPGYAEIVTGKTTGAERKRIIADFKAQRIKYLVNVSVLTTGFDAEHVDVVALLRHTESAGLMQQMIGRGLRLCADKSDCLVLDYAENIETHTPDGDLFNPKIKAPKLYGGADMVVTCPACDHENLFRKRHNPDKFDIDENGYFVDLDGDRIETKFGPMPAHHGRRCVGSLIVAGRVERCTYRWTFRNCGECGEENDIAARYCTECGGEIVDPNEKLRLEFTKQKADPYQVQTDKVLAWSVNPTTSRAGNPMMRVQYVTEYRTVEQFVLEKRRREYDAWQSATDDGKHMPETITYFKDRASGFWRIINYNGAPDEVPDVD